MQEISKKELLQETGISYGQLYRWKREGLIPEDWFIKRSAFTGQETYFPRDRILPRIQAILELKDSHSLDEIRNQLVDNPLHLSIRNTLLGMTDMEPEFVDRLAVLSQVANLGIESLAAVVALYEMSARAAIDVDKTRLLINDALGILAASAHLPTSVSLVKTQDNWHFILSSQTTWITTDQGLSLFETVQLADVAERIRANALGIMAAAENRNTSERTL